MVAASLVPASVGAREEIPLICMYRYISMYKCYMYVFVIICICICVSICICIYIYIYNVNAYTCMCMCMCMHMYNVFADVIYM
jgi:hypothetical protein